ncbi:MAG: lysylphosphatidylglycerol synthase domain-containing protein [Phycisphaerales bacterium JB060]
MQEPLPPSESTPPDTGAPPRAGLRIAVQVVGFLIGILLLGWCVRLALSDENREALERLADAPPGALVSLIGLSVVGVVANGLIFWATLRPVRRLVALDVIATNALATFLANLPFKIGLLARIAIHNRRDKVPMAMIFGWFGAVTATLVLVSAALIGAGLLRSVLGVWTVPVAIGLMVVLSAAMVAIAKRLSGRQGHRRLSRLIGRVGGRRALKLARSEVIRELHMGLDMLASGRWVAFVVAFRMADFGAQAWRWVVAGELVGSDISPTDGLLISGGHFLAGALSPVGMLGFREGAAMGTAELLGLEARGFAPIALLTAGSELVVVIAGAGLAIAWLRLDRVLRARLGRTSGKPAA